MAVSKYADALPLYRQEQMLARLGIDLSRATLASWMVRAGELVQPLVNRMREEILDSGFVQCDESRFQVLQEPGKPAESLSYVWVQRGGPVDHPLILYEYDPSRSAEVPKRLFEGFQGVLQTDGYEGYGAIGREPGTRLLKALTLHRQRGAAVRLQTGAKSRGLEGRNPDRGTSPLCASALGRQMRLQTGARSSDPAIWRGAPTRGRARPAPRTRSSCDPGSSLGSSQLGCSVRLPTLRAIGRQSPRAPAPSPAFASRPGDEGRLAGRGAGVPPAAW